MSDAVNLQEWQTLSNAMLVLRRALNTIGVNEMPTLLFDRLEDYNRTVYLVSRLNPLHATMLAGFRLDWKPGLTTCPSEIFIAEEIGA